MTFSILPSTSDQDANDENSATKSAGNQRTTSVQMLTNSLSLLSFQLISWLLSLAVALVLPRYLGPSIVGSLYFSMSVIGISTVFMGLSNTDLIIKAVARKPATVEPWLSSGMTIRVVVGILMLLFAPTALLISGYSNDIIFIVIIMGISSIISSLSEFLGAVLQGLGWMGRRAAIGVLNRLAVTGGTLALVLAGRGVVEMVGIGIPVELATLALLLVLFHRWGYRLARPSLVMIRHILAGSTSFLLSGICLVVYSQLNILLLNHLAGEEAVAWYGAPIRLLGTAMFIPTVLLGAAYPVLAQLHTTDPSALLIQARRVLIGVITCATPLAIVLVLYGDAIVIVLYGEAFAPAGPVMRVFGLFLTAIYLNTFVGRLLQAVDRQLVWAGVMAVVTVLALPLYAGLIMWGQSVGQASVAAAYGLLISELAMTAAGLVILSRHQLGTTCAQVLGKAGLATLTFAMAYLILAPLLPLVGLITGTVSYLAVAWWLRLVPIAELIAIQRLIGERLSVIRRSGWSGRLNASESK